MAVLKEGVNGKQSTGQPALRVTHITLARQPVIKIQLHTSVV